MLKPAQLYKEELQKKMINTWYDDRYKYYHCGWHNVTNVEDNENEKRSMVSVDKDDNIVGYISYFHNSSDTANNFGAICFDENQPCVFGADLYKAFKDIFFKYNYHRVEFMCVQGNPIEDQYLDLTYRYGGRTWVTRDSVKINNEYYNETWFEILSVDYMEAIRCRAK